MFRRIWVLGKQTWRGYSRDQCGQYAAGISYYVLFSIVPLAILAFSVFGYVLRNDERREEFVDYVLDQIPLTQSEGRDDIESLVENVQAQSTAFAVGGAIFALWSSSAMFASIRRSLNNVWGVEEVRPWVQAKVVDFVQIGALSAILLLSMVLTGIVRWVREASADEFWLLGAESWLWEVPPILITAAVTFAAFLVLYRVVPASHPRVWDVLPGAILATLLFEALKNSFAFYVANFNNYDRVYGSIAGVVLFLFYTYLSSSILLLGAETARTFERYRAGEFEALIHPTTPGEPLPSQAMRAVRGLFVRQ